MTTNPYEFRMDDRPPNHARTSLEDLRSWTPAHSAAARFLGECFAAGALLGLVSELTRPMWGQRHE